MLRTGNNCQPLVSDGREVSFTGVVTDYAADYQIKRIVGELLEQPVAGVDDDGKRQQRLGRLQVQQGIG